MSVPEAPLPILYAKKFPVQTVDVISELLGATMQKPAIENTLSRLLTESDHLLRSKSLEKSQLTLMITHFVAIQVPVLLNF